LTENLKSLVTRFKITANKNNKQTTNSGKKYYSREARNENYDSAEMMLN